MLIVSQDSSAKEIRPIAQDAWAQHDNDTDNGAARWKGKGKAIVQNSNDNSPPIEVSSEAFTVDWTKYEPPEGLKYLGDIDSEMIMQIIQQSIDRVKARIADEEDARKAAAETEKPSHDEAANEEKEAVVPKDKGIEGKQHEDSSPTNSLDWPLHSTQDISRTDGTSGPFSTELSKRPPGVRGLMKLFRKRNQGSEKGESSAAGAAHSSGEYRAHSVKRSIVSDLINKAKEPEAPDVECVSCLDDFASSETVRAPCHNYCKPCFHRLIASACQNEQHWPPKCCLNTISETTVHSNVSPQQWQEYAERAVEWNQPVADRIYCSQPECSLFIRPEYVILAQGLARCSDGHYTCIICRNAQHAGDACPQDEDVIRTNELAEAAGWKRCNRCQAFVEHSDGCQHMTCRCGAEFCYVCGAPWQTCGCTMTHLAHFKRQAEARRRERLDREAREEAEIQEALRLVREFELEEERNAQILREKERRLAEERWRKRHQELQAERREAAARFEELREVISELHETQRTAVQQHQEKRENQLAIKGDAVRRRMRDLHDLERETGRAIDDARIARRETELKAEYVARAIEERHIEEQYAAKLREFFGEDGETKMQAAMTELRTRMDRDFRAWRKWRDNDLAGYCHSLREEQGIREELMEEKERRLETRRHEVMLGVAKRKTAELRWVREVFEERGRLLDELENSEIEKLGDVGDQFPEDPAEQEAWIVMKE
ncbi:hypothetical protein F5B22DRAFT_191962 [Xylaria bambusicola]|uniref:uncharacterized protein n=1 Tax=Xylaria bambusicola TaxID=326684 RepID=UPI002007C6E5|nr:uncharacterized protein F5B22DRAFT_191962 [Xylaria bambusicola]KAI0515192.1 hypothetical protein F5B22DRAFT_191962 [Xylaria bambusicola]